MNCGSLLSTSPRTLEASRTFDKVAKASETLQPLYERVSSGSEVQKEIDRVAIKMLGLTWDSEVLNTLYGTIKFELDAMQIIFGRITKGEKTDKKNVRRVGETLKLHKQV